MVASARMIVPISADPVSARRERPVVRSVDASHRHESARSFVFTTLWVAGFLGGGYVLLWKPLIDRWLF